MNPVPVDLEKAIETSLASRMELQAKLNWSRVSLTDPHKITKRIQGDVNLRLGISGDDKNLSNT